MIEQKNPSNQWVIKGSEKGPFYSQLIIKKNFTQQDDQHENCRHHETPTLGL